MLRGTGSGGASAGRISRFMRCVCTSVALAAASTAVAQVRPDAGQVLQQTREPLRLPPPREADVLPTPPEPKPALPVQPALRVKVASFTFTGNTVYSDAFLQEVVREYVGRELTFDDLNDGILIFTDPFAVFMYRVFDKAHASGPDRLLVVMVVRKRINDTVT